MKLSWDVWWSVNVSVARRESVLMVGIRYFSFGQVYRLRESVC